MELSEQYGEQQRPGEAACVAELEDTRMMTMRIFIRYVGRMANMSIGVTKNVSVCGCVRS